MTQEQINELRKLAEAATPGPWAAAVNNNMDNKVSHSFGDICQTGKDIGDAIFIAAANPAAILALIQQRDELLAALKHIREYWNGDQNDEAMADACFAAISISEEAVAKAEAKS